MGGTGSALGNGTITGYSVQTGKMVDARVEFTLGTTSTVGSTLTFTLPFTASTTGITVAKNKIGDVYLDDASGNPWVGILRLETSTTARVLLLDTSGTYPQVVATSSTAPFGSAYASTDVIYADMRYERT